MPRGLAIETSGRNGSIAVAQDGRVLAEETFSHGLKHAAGIVPIIDRLCAAQGWKPADVEEIYVSAGPGSFDPHLGRFLDKLQRRTGLLG